MRLRDARPGAPAPDRDRDDMPAAAAPRAACKPTPSLAYRAPATRHTTRLPLLSGTTQSTTRTACPHLRMPTRPHKPAPQPGCLGRGGPAPLGPAACTAQRACARICIFALGCMRTGHARMQAGRQSSHHHHHPIPCSLTTATIPALAFAAAVAAAACMPAPPARLGRPAATPQAPWCPEPHSNTPLSPPSPTSAVPTPAPRC